MIWTSVNPVIRIFAGVFGTYIAAFAATEHRLGFVGHTAVSPSERSTGAIFPGFVSP
jgi:hypothetical protein